MREAREAALQMQKAVRVCKKVLGGVVVGEMPQRKVPESRVCDLGVRLVCPCGRARGSLIELCPRCGRDRYVGLLSW